MRRKVKGMKERSKKLHIQTSLMESQGCINGIKFQSTSIVAENLNQR